MPQDDFLVMPETDITRHVLVHDLFLTAIELPTVQRSALLERIHSQNSMLGAEVKELLKAHYRAGCFLSAPTIRLRHFAAWAQIILAASQLTEYPTYFGDISN